MVRRLRGIADRANRTDRAIWLGKAGKTTRYDTDNIGKFFQSIHNH